MNSKTSAFHLRVVPSPAERQLPKSATSVWFGVVGLFCFSVSISVLRHFFREIEPFRGTLIALASYFVPVLGLELVLFKTWRRASTGLDFSRRPLRDGNACGRAIERVLGLYLTLTVGLAAYAVFPEYHGRFYLPYFRLLQILVPILSLLAIPYFLWLEPYLVNLEDGYWNAAQVVRGRFSRIQKAVLTQHFLGWAVKFFFAPLMFVYADRAVAQFLAFNPHTVFGSFRELFDFLHDGLFGLDVVIAASGYFLTFRVLDSQIRSTEPTFTGWFFALLCYQPFWNMFERSYLGYGGGRTPWGFWSSGNPVLYGVWGVTILVCVFVYLWATVPFGIRFSNLTHRGILTDGPYAWTKHPAYVSKNLSWWLISVPFLSREGPSEALRYSLMLLGLNAVYLLRARTEERHLSADPAYVEYATRMNARSVFSGLGRRIPWLQFKPGS